MTFNVYRGGEFLKTVNGSVVDDILTLDEADHGLLVGDLLTRIPEWYEGIMYHAAL